MSEDKIVVQFKVLDHHFRAECSPKDEGIYRRAASDLPEIIATYRLKYPNTPLERIILLCAFHALMESYKMHNSKDVDDFLSVIEGLSGEISNSLSK